MTKNSSHSVDNPLFLVGSVRSGTTLLRLMLDSHPNISFAAESESFIDQISEQGDFPEMEGFYNYLESSIVHFDKSLIVDKKLDYQLLIYSFIEQIRTRKNGSIVGATIHKYFDRVQYLWDKPKFIHLVRDPRDVASSVINMGWSGNVWDAVDSWLDAEVLWDKLVKTLSEDQYIELKYEDLIQNNQAQLARVCHFMGVEDSNEMLSYADRTTYSVPDPSLVYQWKNKMEDYNVQLIEFKTHKLLRDKGYELSGLELLSIDSIDVKSLKKENTKLKRRFRIKRYGFTLLLFSKLCKFIKIPLLSNFIQKKIDKISQYHIK